MRDGAALRRRLMAWYRANRRELPWRAAPGELADAYRVWVSEIMLQQTRVAAAIPYYRRFLQRFPTLEALARAREASVLAAWSGLGYYRRARQLRAAAQAVREQHGGRFPSSFGEALALPGVGEYTAAAVLSIAFGQPRAAADGNARRVVGRLLGRAVSLTEARERLTAWLPRTAPGDFNQAVMELGATVCTPRAPQCRLCPLHVLCRGRGELAVAPAATARRRVTLHYGLARDARGCVFLVQRPPGAPQMPGLWELPETGEPRSESPPLARVRHSITTRLITAELHPLPRPPRAGRWVHPDKAAQLPLTGLARKLLIAASGRPAAGRAQPAAVPRRNSAAPSRRRDDGGSRRRL
jgi:A/G-specific adenine glycosylase